MTDIVERLRATACPDVCECDATHPCGLQEAADEIERLTALHKAADAQKWHDLQEARAEIRGTRMRIADLEKQLFRATGRTP